MSATEAIGEAVYENNKSFSLGNLSDRMFARLFRGLVYAQIWEDPVCDMAALELSEGDDIVCIASGGCNMMSYLTASPASILVADLSPWHVQLNRLKLAAAKGVPDHAALYSIFGKADDDQNVALLERYAFPLLDPQDRAFWNARHKLRSRKSMFTRGFYRHGVLGNFLQVIHMITRAGKVDFDRLLGAQSLDDQKQFYYQEIDPLFDKRLVKFAAKRRASLFGLGIPPAQYDKLAADAGGDIIPVLRERTRKLFCDFPVSENYFLWQAATLNYKADGTGPVPPYLEEKHFDTVKSNAERVTVANRSVTDMLAEAPEGSKSVYVLLDAQDWMTDAQLTALWTQITRTARPGARVLFRTGGRDDILPGRVPTELMDRWRYDVAASVKALADDRSAIYGGVHVYRFAG